MHLERALDRLGRRLQRVPGMLTKPTEAIERLGPIDEPLIGVYAHWVYGPHTTDGVVGKDSPLLLASNFSGTWPGLVGLLNTAACLESVGRVAVAHGPMPQTGRDGPWRSLRNGARRAASGTYECAANTAEIPPAAAARGPCA